MDSHITRIVVVGGTAAGWTAAARLASAFRETVSVTVLETPSRSDFQETGQVAAVGPEIQRDLFDRLGVPEEEWMRACCASFSVAVRHVNWRTEGPAEIAARTMAGGGVDHFYSPCSEIPECEDSLLSDHWHYRRKNGETIEPFDHACFREPPLMDAGKSPRWLDGRAALPYGWHVDSRMFTEFLRNLATGRFGVRAVRDELLHAERDADGMLTVLHTAKGRALPGEFFLDCSGPEGLLIAGTLQEPFTGARDRLPCDSAVTVTVPHDHTAHGIEPFATATALPAGRAWKMPLPGRFGAGYVYAREWTDPDEAASTLCGLWGLRPERAVVRHIALRTGHSRRSWVKNCVAVGPAACSLEPPAAGPLSGGVLDSLDRLVRDFPSRQDREGPAARFNRAVGAGSARARDAAQLLYRAAPRADTPFWKSQKELPLSAELADCLAAYRAGLTPDGQELDHVGVLAALAPGRAAPRAALAHRQDVRDVADAHFLRIKRQQQILLETLPTAEQYLRRLHGRPAPAQDSGRTAHRLTLSHDRAGHPPPQAGDPHLGVVAFPEAQKGSDLALSE
ncbi:tryptophan 7-halogenase [Streptomyces peucetius]|uniref:Tryptophan 7-halogenase n=1 Tax=Streptomyces peucetius TaxID=1950 RepID=A0ABY6IFZ4_STRPE|nr:tryptophan 7-halogenase [Streptomyces peucetius]UYQ64849.1 tryptophan 7-halogenase [Streptomyces peucetius]